VIFFTARMTNQSEVVAVLCNGISFYRMLAPFMATAVFLAVISFYMNAYVVPHAVYARLDFEAVYVKSHRPYEARNIHKKISPQTSAYVYSYNQYHKEGLKFSLEKFDTEGHLVEKIASQKVKWLGENSWRLEKVLVKQIKTDGEVISHRKTLDTTLLLSPDDIYQRENLAESLTYTELLDYIDLETDRGSTYLKELVLEKHERIVYPFATIILTLIGVAFSTQKRRGGIAFQITLGLILCFIYILIQSIAKVTIGEKYSEWVALWLPNFIFLGLAVFFIRMAPK